MNSPLRHLRTIPFCLLAVFILTAVSAAQSCTPTGNNVVTWHNDNNRTGWQQNETCLNPTTVTATGNSFGLLFQWNQNVSGRIYAQPLAVTLTQSVGTTCSSPCSLVLAATENDMLYAFNASPSQFSQTPVWSINLAGQLTVGGYTGTYVNCLGGAAQSFFEACVGMDDTTGEPSPFKRTNIGVTGTPVIDMSPAHPVLYVVGAVCFSSAPLTMCGNNTTATAGYYLFAVDIVSKSVTAKEITGQVPGQAPSSICTSDYPTSGNITFSPVGNPNAHLQRSALLLLPVNNVNTVFVAFADLPERNNGWMFGYQLTGQPGSGSFTQTAIFASTPYGTGGGFWGAGAGPASDGTYIYTATANGTIFDPVSQTPPVDIGDALLKLQPGTTYPPGLTIADWWTPPNVLSYSGTKGPGLCKNDMDVASGGVLLPTGFKYNGNSVVINADKQSNIYMTYQNNLGGYNSAGGNNIETVLTPCVPNNNGPGNCGPVPPSQGYWASPAYWFDGTNYWLYYAATMNDDSQGISPADVPPEALNAYQLQSSGPPISQIPYANSGTSNAQIYPILFCDYAPTPSVSSSGSTAGSGIVWAIEEYPNMDNNPKTQGSNPQDCHGSLFPKNPGALHAFCAAKITGQGTPCPSAMTELYSSRTLVTPLGPAHGFTTPTVFSGQVYVGTDQFLNVFGICSTVGGCLN